MAFKFPFTNYHELNLTWVLDQLKSLFEKSEENVTVIENYNGRLTSVETELPLVEETAQGAAQQSVAAATLAQQAKSTADTAQENAIQAQGLAGTARQEAQQAQAAADAATQAAQQAQATAQNFDGRITQAENDAAAALEASRSFENRVQAAITTANNAAQTATNAQGIATRADQNAALALDTLNAQRSELERIGREQAALITEETESGKTEIETLAQSVLDSIPSDYTALSALVDKKAPVIINNASGSIASFDDGADDMKIQKLVVNIEPTQAGSGDPAPDNVRPISGNTGAEIERTGVNVWDEEWEDGYYDRDTGEKVASDLYNRRRSKNMIPILPNTQYYTNFVSYHLFYDADKNFISSDPNGDLLFTTPQNARYMTFYQATIEWQDNITINYPSTDHDYHAYTGTTIPITFPTTIYGGSDEVIGGKLIVNTFNGLITALISDGYQNDDDFYYGYLPNDFLTPSIIGGIFSYLSSDSPSVNKHDCAYVFPSRLVRMNISQLDRTVEAYRAYLAQHPLQVVYNVAPTEYQLTPQEMKTVYGTNNIWADAGPVSVDYPSDTKLYIDGKLAELQATILENI